MVERISGLFPHQIASVLSRWSFPLSISSCDYIFANTGYFHRLYISLIPLPLLLPFSCFLLLFLRHLSPHSSLFLSSLNHDIRSMVSVRHPVISGSLQPHGLCPTRFLCPCDSLDKNTRVGCISSSRESSWPSQGTYISCVSCTAGRFFTTEPLGKVKVAQSCPTLCNPVEPLGKPPLINGQIFSIRLLLNLSTFLHFHGHHPR